MARRTKAEAEQTRLKILKAALDLFVEKGYERTTFEDVAGRIRLTKGAVYWHFKSKPDLLIDVVVHMMALHADALGRALSDPSTLGELQEHFTARAKLVAKTPSSRKFFHMMMRLDWSAAKFAPVKQRLRQLEMGIFAVIERTLGHLQSQGVVRAEVDVPAVTAVLGSMWLGLLKSEMDQCLEMDLAQAVGFGFSAIGNAIRASCD
jgi:TetR/AcrR family acrAB operon transcriptional repressor